MPPESAVPWRVVTHSEVIVGLNLVGGPVNVWLPWRNLTYRRIPLFLAPAPRARNGLSVSGRRASRRGRQEFPSKRFRQVEHHVMAALHGDRPPALCFCLFTKMGKR